MIVLFSFEIDSILHKMFCSLFVYSHGTINTILFHSRHPVLADRFSSFFVDFELTSANSANEKKKKKNKDQNDAAIGTIMNDFHLLNSIRTYKQCTLFI